MIRLGVVPTPLVAFEAQRIDAMGAMVSASHNPFHDNGIKLFAPGGTKLPDDVERRIEAELDTLAGFDPERDRRGASAMSSRLSSRSTGRRATSTTSSGSSRVVGSTG